MISIRTWCIRSSRRLNIIGYKMTIRPISDQAVLRAAESIHQSRDPNTLSNYNAWRTKHSSVTFSIDFDKRKLTGHVEHELKKIGEDSKIVLDSSFLKVSDVTVDGEKANWELSSSRIEPYGSPLTINLGKSQHNVGATAKVKIDVETTDECTALQWLTPPQTSNKKHPYMFSQCQAIHARSVFPCQDTPDVKATFDFNIRSSLPVIASGLSTGFRDFQPGSNNTASSLIYTFHQPVPIPSYLFALAAGDIASASVGPRSTVYTGPDELTGVQWEFEEDTERYIQIAEKIVYPYAWTIYNVLVLPPSFPYGGMENPQTTFATPTIVSRDRKNVDVIAHELSHSWSGNLVSCASWEHFWLNEGWTTYLERRIQAVAHGSDQHRDLSAIIGWKALTDAVDKYGHDHEFTKLIPDLRGKDPDDAFSTVPYEKGFVFLYQLEKLLTKEKWDKFIPHYFTVFKEKSLDSYEFKSTLLDFYKDDTEASKKLATIDFEAAFYTPGLPEKPKFDTTLADIATDLAKKWQALNQGDSDFKPHKKDVEHFEGQQSYVFLESIQQFEKPLSPELVYLLGETYGFAGSYNVELVSRYYTIGLKAKAEKLYQPTAKLISEVGRMKFVLPLFKLLLKRDSHLAKQTFDKNKDFYHPICRAMVEKAIKDHEQGNS